MLIFKRSNSIIAADLRRRWAVGSMSPVVSLNVADQSTERRHRYHGILTFTAARDYLQLPVEYSAECTTKSPIEAEIGALGSIIIHGDLLSRKRSATSKRPPHRPIRVFDSILRFAIALSAVLCEITDLSIVRSRSSSPAVRLWTLGKRWYFGCGEVNR
jgi:hypothetical protein